MMERDRNRKWQTKPLDCWYKLKEMRLNHYRQVATANEDGKILVTGSIAAPYPLVDGLGKDVIFFGGEPYAASIGFDERYSIEVMQVAEERGYARDMCGYMRNYWGSMFSNRFYFSNGANNKFPRPTFCLTENVCDAGHAKWYQVVSEHFGGIPVLTIDYPAGPYDTKKEQKIEYVAGQMSDAIEKMEKITGRTYDDELFLEASKNYFEAERLWGEICLLNAAIPAPLDLKSLLALLPTSQLFRNKREGIEALELLRAEVKDRIANQIGAVENERIRLVTDLTPPWNFVRLFRSFGDRGAVFVGIWIYTVNGGNVWFKEDGTVGVARTPEEEGLPLRTRDDVLRAWGHHAVAHPILLSLGCDPQVKAQQIVALARHFHADGVVMHYNRGCPLCTLSSPEAKMSVEKAGIPVGVYEGNFSDCRDVDNDRVIKAIDSFLEFLDPAFSLSR